MILGTFTQYTGFQHKQVQREPKPRTAKIEARQNAEALKDKLIQDKLNDEEAYWDSLLTGEDYFLGSV